MIPRHSCVRTRQEARHVHERHERDVERVTRAHEARGLHRRVDVEHAGERARLVADDADEVAAEPSEAADDVLGVALVHLEEVAVVDDELDHALDVVRLGRDRRGRACRAPASSRSRRSDGSRTAAARGCSAGGRRAGSARPRGMPPRRAQMKCATPDFAACVAAPPSSSNVTSSPVTVFTTSGPVMNMYEELLDHEARSRSWPGE